MKKKTIEFQKSTHC